MSGHLQPIRCCDSECAAVNYCVKGGVQCNGCGLYFCDYNLNEIGYCEDCAAKFGSDEESEEEDQSSDSSMCLCCHSRMVRPVTRRNRFMKNGFES